MKQDLDLSILETLENLHAEWGGGLNQYRVNT